MKNFIYDKIYKSEMQKTTNTNLAKYFSLAIIVYLGLNLTSCASGYFARSIQEVKYLLTKHIILSRSIQPKLTILEFQEYVSIFRNS